MKQKAYKVLALDDKNHLRSVNHYSMQVGFPSLLYKKRGWTYPSTGRLFVFKTIFAAEDFVKINYHSLMGDRYQIWEVTAENCEPLTHRLTLSGLRSDLLQTFWDKNSYQDMLIENRLKLMMVPAPTDSLGATAIRLIRRLALNELSGRYKHS
jgi:hypothetical protein